MAEITMSTPDVRTTSSPESLPHQTADSHLAHRISNVLSPAALFVDSVLAREQHCLGERSQSQLRSVLAAIEEITRILEPLRQQGRAAQPGADVTVHVAPPSSTIADPLTLPVGLRILLVDDDPLLLASLSQTLGFDGHELVCASGPDEGIAVATAAVAALQPFAAVITDLSMQGMDGVALAREIKTQGLSAHVILLTGWRHGLAAEEPLPDHVDQVLPKPPRLSVLRQALAKVGRPT
jgi:CheY-like chemotaxis protein